MRDRNASSNSPTRLVVRIMTPEKYSRTRRKTRRRSVNGSDGVMMHDKANLRQDRFL